MKKRLIQITALTLMIMALTGCGTIQAVISPLIPMVTEESDLPHRMVQRIDVLLTETDAEFERHYQTQENLTAILQMLRHMMVTDIPNEAPALDSNLSYYTITATYASGEQQIYRLLSLQYLKVGEEPWLQISPELAVGFTEYLQAHQSDDGSYIPPETEPVETGESVPADTNV